LAELRDRDLLTIARFELRAKQHRFGCANRIPIFAGADEMERLDVGHLRLMETEYSRLQ
jgi:hypothetical protein